MQSRFNKIVKALGNFKITFKSDSSIKADFLGSMGYNGTYRTLFTHNFNGEKNFGEIGPIKSYRVDYQLLSLRSWQSYLESEITQTIVNRFRTWVIGKGLKLQADPAEYVLNADGIKLDLQSFSKLVESKFQVYKKSRLSDYSGMKTLDKLAGSAFVNSIVGGDLLVILRYIDGFVKIQLVDGCHVQSPIYGNIASPAILENGNRIIDGVEINPKGEHVRYYVRTDDLNIVPIEAKEPGGLQVAFLVYGGEYRLNNVRGLPLISVCLETLKKLERYKEATVASAEERQKIAFSIEHNENSTGENPMAKQVARALDVDGASDLPKDSSGKELADQVAATTNKMAFNMPIGSQLKMLESKNELYFKDFYNVNIDIVCAALQIPPNVAMSKYDANFSASRAALKDWEHTLNVKRDHFSSEFYQPIYNFWLEIQILENKINAPGYLAARSKNNSEIVEAFRCARFVGASVPHIDPEKEVNAERLKLGASAEHLPLTTMEAATEALSNGEYDTNIDQFARETDRANKLGVKPIEKTPPQQQTAKD
jgi:capsid protein